MVIAAINHDTTQFLWLTLVAMTIDGTDGFLARKFNVKKNIPWIDGATLDNIVDYITYVFAPAVLFWVNNYIPHNLFGTGIIAAVLLSSCYQFCRSDAKTDNQNYYFLGFPDYWNIIAFYVIALNLDTSTTSIILLLCSILVFIPIKFLYPSRTKQLQKLTIPLTALWFVAYIVIMLQLPTPNLQLVTLSLLYPLYYIVGSLYLTYKTKITN